MAASQGPGCKAIVKQWIRDVFSHLAIACHAAVKAAMYGHASQAQGAAGAFAEIRANGGGWPSQPSTSGGFPVASQSQQYRPLGGIYSSQATQARQLEAHPGRFIAGRRTVTASGLSTRETAPKKIALATYTGSVNEISATASVKQPAVIDLTEDSDDDRDAVTWPSGHAKTPSAASLQHAHSMMSG